MISKPSRGEIWWCELPEVSRRPVVVLSRNAAISNRRRSIVAPCTTNIRRIASEVLLEEDYDPVPLTSAVNLDSIENVSIAVLTERIGRLSDQRMREICGALSVAAGCE